MMLATGAMGQWQQQCDGNDAGGIGSGGSGSGDDDGFIRNIGYDANEKKKTKQ